MESDSQEARLFHDGIGLFNDREWFEAHETWEEVWHMASGRKKKFYQGLIQLAVTLEHVRRGNPRGVRSVWGTCVPKFDGLDDVYMGIPVRPLIDAVGQAIKPILDLPPSYFDASRPRGQDLPMDWELVPRIELEHDPFG